MHKGVRRSINIILGLGVFILLIARPLYSRLTTPMYADPDPDSCRIVLDASFGSMSLNQQVRFGTSFTPNLSAPLLLETKQLARQSLPLHATPDAIFYGSSAQAPVGWVYTELVNSSKVPQDLVLSFPHYRCDQATLYAGTANRPDKVGTLANRTKLTNRFFPYLAYAFPVHLTPGDTTLLLLRTERHAGVHEVDLRLSEQANYVESAFTGMVSTLLQLLFCVILTLVALVIGGIFRYKAMSYYGGFMVVLCLLLAAHHGYLNFLPYSSATSINDATITIVLIFAINFAGYPFIYQVVKSALPNPALYRRVVSVFTAVNIALILLHLLPFRYYDAINLLAHRSKMPLSLINMGIQAYTSVVAYRRGTRWLLWINLLIYIPVLLPLLSLFQPSSWQAVFRQELIDPVVVTLIVSYIAFDQLRQELVLKRSMQAKMRELKAQTDQLRRQEIERIGRDLHDQIGNTLAAALGYLGRGSGNLKKPTELINDAIGELRFLSHNLVKDNDRPLTDKVETLVSRFNDFSAIRLVFQDYTDQQIDQLHPTQQQNIYSIIQELLTNIVRHSRATQAHVQFFFDGTNFDICVEDDGRGFDYTVAVEKGIGLRNMIERARLSDGILIFDSTPTGTTVVLKIKSPDAHSHHHH
jgi:signal transduction histidine kinase